MTLVATTHVPMSRSGAPRAGAGCTCSPPERKGAGCTCSPPERKGAGRACSPPERKGARGFTLIEIMVVLAIIAVLIGIAAGRYDRSILRAREAVLKQDLSVMRNAIQQYTLDKQQAPQSLQELASAGYLREIPLDPITRARDWQLEFEDLLFSADQSATGLSDVRSNSDAISSEGTAYNTW